MHESTVSRVTSGKYVNTPHGISAGTNARLDGYEIRTAAVAEGIPCITTIQGLAAAVQNIEALREQRVEVRSLQEWAELSRTDA